MHKNVTYLFVLLTAAVVLCFGLRTPNIGLAAIPPCMKVDPGNWGYLIPGACVTPVPAVPSPPSGSSVWSQTLVAGRIPDGTIGQGNYINLFGDSAGSYTPQPLNYKVLGGDSNLQTQLYQDSNGIWFLAMWQNTAYRNTLIPPYMPTPQSSIGENIMVELSGTNQQVVATNFGTTGYAINYYVEPTTYSGNNTYAALVNTGLIVFQIGPVGFTPITPTNVGFVPTPTPTTVPTDGPSPSPSSSPTVPPTAAPIVFTPSFQIFAGPTSTPAIIAVSENNYSGAFSASPTPAGIVSASITGNTLTVYPVSSGNAGVVVSDSNSQTATFPVTVNATPPPTPGPILFSPNPVALAGPTSTPVAVAILETNYTGSFSASPSPGGVVSTSITGNTLTVSPLAAGSTNITVVNGSTQSAVLPVTVATSPPTPGPILPVPSSLTYSGATAPPQVIALSETNYSGAFTASPAPGGVVTTSVTGNNVTVSPVGGGTTTIHIANSSTQTVNVPVTVITPPPTATPIPMPIWTNPTPGPTPTSVANVPFASTPTFVATIKCLVANTSGADILSFNTIFDAGAGLCDNTLANPTGSQGAHVYENAGTKQTNFYNANTPGNGLSVGTWFVAWQLDGANLNTYTCAIPYTVNNCVLTQTADTTLFPTTPQSGFVGLGEDGLSRPSTNTVHVWGLAEYNTVLSQQSINQLAASSIADPYTVSTPTPPPPNSGLPYTFQETGVVCGQAQNVPYGTCPFISKISTLLSISKASVVISPANLAGWWNKQNFGGGCCGSGNPYVFSKASGNGSGINPGAINANANAVTVRISNIYTSKPFDNVASHLPNWAVNRGGCKSYINEPGKCNNNTDQQITIIDLDNNFEIDGWHCANVAGGGTFDNWDLHYTTPGQPFMPCAYGAKYKLGGPGSWATSQGGGSGQAGGAQLAAYILTPAEILAAEADPVGHPINHALGMNENCLATSGVNGVWPARTSLATDGACSGTGPFANYGQFLHLISPIPSSYSAACKVILQAAKDYGIFLTDTGGGGWEMNMLHPVMYSLDPNNPSNPWPTIVSQLQAAGDASSGISSNGDFSWHYCLNRLSSSDFEVVQKTQQ